MIRKLFGLTKEQKIARAIQRAAVVCAECEHYRVLMGAYRTLLASVDPQIDWWRFATLKQHEVDARIDYHLLRSDADKALELVDTMRGEL